MIQQPPSWLSDKDGELGNMTKRRILQIQKTSRQKDSLVVGQTNTYLRAGNLEVLESNSKTGTAHHGVQVIDKAPSRVGVIREKQTPTTAGKLTLQQSDIASLPVQSEEAPVTVGEVEVKTAPTEEVPFDSQNEAIGSLRNKIQRKIEHEKLPNVQALGRS